MPEVESVIEVVMVSSWQTYMSVLHFNQILDKAAKYQKQSASK